MENQHEIKDAFILLVDINKKLKVIQEFSVVDATTALTDLVRHITDGHGEYADLRHDTKVALAFYVMGFQRSLLK